MNEWRVKLHSCWQTGGKKAKQKPKQQQQQQEKKAFLKTWDDKSNSYLALCSVI